MKDYRMKINDEWAITRFDNLNFALMQTKERIHPVKKTISTTEGLVGYYPNPVAALRAYVLRATGECNELTQICDHVDNVVANLKHITMEK